MGVDHAATLIAGIDTESGSPSVLERFLASEWGDVEEWDPDEPDLGWARALLQERFTGGAETYGLEAVLAGSSYAGDEDPDACRVVLGIVIARVAERDSASWVEGPVSPDAVHAGLDRARDALTKLGIDAEPRLLLVGTES